MSFVTLYFPRFVSWAINPRWGSSHLEIWSASLLKSAWKEDDIKQNSENISFSFFKCDRDIDRSYSLTNHRRRIRQGGGFYTFVKICQIWLELRYLNGKVWPPCRVCIMKGKKMAWKGFYNESPQGSFFIRRIFLRYYIDIITHQSPITVFFFKFSIYFFLYIYSGPWSPFTWNIFEDFQVAYLKLMGLYFSFSLSLSTLRTLFFSL